MDSQERNTGFRIDPATGQDAAAIQRMIRGLADYERLSHMVVSTEESLRSALFGSRPVAEAIVARAGADAVGFALFFHTYSTFAGRPGMYLEDLYVEPQWRGRGLGRGLLARVARIAAERGCDRLGWSVLDWNEPALGFYRSLGAELVQDWVGYRLSGEPFRRLAETGD